MITTLEVTFTPAEFGALKNRDLKETVCVVFDVLRATSTMITALANGATAVIPVSEIAEALQLREREPDVLLAGEREGLRIRREVSGSVDFDLGNSPREFTRDAVGGKQIVMTTTNGTRALRACAGAGTVLIGSFLNLRATAGFLERNSALNLLLVCSGTFEQVAYEDVLGAGALCDLLWPSYGCGSVADSAQMARQLYQLERHDLLGAITQSRNGRRLMDHLDLREDVPFCARLDSQPIVAELSKDGAVRLLSDS